VFEFFLTQMKLRGPILRLGTMSTISSSAMNSSWEKNHNIY